MWTIRICLLRSKKQDESFKTLRSGIGRIYDLN